MNLKLIVVFFFVLFHTSCDSKVEKVITPAMEEQARETVVQYLVKNNLPVKNLKKVESKASPKPDFGFLYTGGGRCIEFIVNCHGDECKDWGKYPYDEHGDECPK